VKKFIPLLVFSGMFFSFVQQANADIAAVDDDNPQCEIIIKNYKNVQEILDLRNRPDGEKGITLDIIRKCNGKNKLEKVTIDAVNFWKDTGKTRVDAWPPGQKGGLIKILLK
jgi:hypothetical protein